MVTMEIILDPTKGAYENANAYFEESKRLKKKLEDTKNAIEETRREIEKENQRINEKQEREERKKSEKAETKAAKKEWYMQYHWFFTSGGLLAIGGKSAGQNEEIVKKRLEENDLFFHADIVGAPAVVLKNGKNASEQDLKETAQFAACYSSAWKTGYSIVDIYYVTKEQVSKSPPSGEYIQKGSFLISGKKNYFRGVGLKLLIGNDKEGKLLCLPQVCGTEKFKMCFLLEPGRYSKDMVGEKLARQLGKTKEEIIALLPTGNTSFSRLK